MKKLIFLFLFLIFVKMSFGQPVIYNVKKSVKIGETFTIVLIPNDTTLVNKVIIDRHISRLNIKEQYESYFTDIYYGGWQKDISFAYGNEYSTPFSCDVPKFGVGSIIYPGFTFLGFNEGDTMYYRFYEYKSDGFNNDILYDTCILKIPITSLLKITETINLKDSNIEAIYTTNGQKVDNSNIEKNNLYIVKRKNKRAVKLIIR